MSIAREYISERVPDVERTKFVQAGDAREPVSYTELQVSGILLPVATTSTLPAGFYDGIGLDTRYAADRERVELTDKLKLFVQNSPHVPQRLVSLFETCVFEPKFLSMYFDSPDPNKEDLGKIRAFFGHYDVKSHEEVAKIRDEYYGVPLPIREFARTDVGTVHEVMRLFRYTPGISELADAKPLVQLLIENGIDALEGKERLGSILGLKEQICAYTEQALSHEARRHGKPYMSIHRKRSPLDGIDAATFRDATNNGVIVNPEYLFSDRYDSLLDEPDVPNADKLAFLSHMANGEWTLGHSHSLIYRNKIEGISATHAGVAADYGVSRPGNFLFHDFKLLEKGPYKENFPLDALFSYMTGHYLHRMDTAVADEQNRIDEERYGASIGFSFDGKEYALPLVYEAHHVIPFRALKKDYSSDEYFEYGEECYIAELVDTALEFDLIDKTRRNQSIFNKTKIGHIELGPYSTALIGSLVKADVHNGFHMASIGIEQILFMKGARAVGGVDAIRDALEQSTLINDPADLPLNAIQTEDELDANGQPLGPRRPLTCYYEWFQRYARPVSKEELEERVVPYRAALFPQS